MAASKSNPWSRKYLVPALIVLTICYTVIYNIMLFNAVEGDAGQDECSAMPGVGNADSPHCLEVRLFRSWHATEVPIIEDEDEGLLSVTPSRKVNVEDGVGIVASSSSILIGTIVDHVTVTAGADHLESLDREIREREERIKHRHALMDQLETSIRTSLNASSNVTPWAQDLMTLQSHLESEMVSHEVTQKRRATFERLAHNVRTSLNSRAMTPWATDLEELRGHLESEMHSSVHAKHKALEAIHARHVARHAEVTQEMAQKMTNLEDHLHQMVSQREDWEAKLLVKYGASKASTTSSPKSFLDKQMHWSSVVAWSKTSWRPTSSSLRGKSDKMSVVKKHDVRHLHWGGMIPKVACITAIHGERHTRARMMYFINNFRLQDYEGPHELVLVYHHTDAEAAELVRKYVDGTFIKAVATHGENVFPSTTAVRYGAWASGADVIARWDFEEWHDPSRLSMQVRAMASTARPACTLSQPDKLDGDKRAAGDSSLIGEKVWMDKHWHPFLKQEHLVLQWSQADHVVELDMENARLVANISYVKQDVAEPQAQETPASTQVQEKPVPTETPVSTQVQEKPVPTVAPLHDYSMSECLEFDHSKFPVDESPKLEKAIGDSVGREMSMQFHKLMRKRHDITQRLQLLCLQSTLEHDKNKQVFMRQHVDQMAGIRAELDKHIASMSSIFAAS